MIDLIVFSAGNNRYALNIENIQRIIQAIELTDIPNVHKLVDGMMSHEGSVIKVLNFRKLIGLPTYDDELRKLFIKFQESTKNWFDELVRSVEQGKEFTQTTNPHSSEMGVWLDNFNSYDNKVSTILKDLVDAYKQLYLFGAEMLKLSNSDKESAMTALNAKGSSLVQLTVDYISEFANNLEAVANSLQKLVLYENSGSNFAIKVDSIEDISHVEESMIMSSNEDNSANEFLELHGVLDIDGVLINVIKTLKIPN